MKRGKLKLWPIVLGAFSLGVLVGFLASKGSEEPERTPSEKFEEGDFSSSFMERLPARMEELGIRRELVSETDEGVAVVKVADDLSPLVVNLEITRLVKELGGKVFRAVEYEDGRVRMDVGTSEGPTDVVLLLPSPGVHRRTGKIAIIVDDFGYQDDELVRGFCELPREVALSVLPFRKGTARIAEELCKSGHEVLLHLPMEPYKANPGKGAIYVRMSEEEIERKVKEALSQVPCAVGVDNHMGSKATEDRRVMRAILKVLRRRGLFFVDSRTSARSVGYEVALEMGVRAAERTKFLDVVEKREAIVRTLRELADAAAEKGAAVGICHAKPLTLEVLKEELPRLEKMGFSLVPVSQVVSTVRVARGL